MLKHTLILLAIALSQWGCDIDYGENLASTGRFTRSTHCVCANTSG